MVCKFTCEATYNGLPLSQAEAVKLNMEAMYKVMCQNKDWKHETI